ncbi:MAG: hypothetical protein ACK42C_02510 [Aquificaceae bacterium]|jgi:hypothetical protein|uniref:hypothetical protein n=1 Tax=Hydrogenobacter sp. Uz 6-8 TaxID=3384828 RepID=UPI000F154A61|nr:MAG: hypothetical protein D6804_00285 [Aquificota bacterium]
MAVPPYEVYKTLEEELGKEKAEKIGRVIEETLTAIERRAYEQKPILKAELRDELTKELVTKADIAEVRAEIAGVMAEVEKVRAEVKVLQAKFTEEFKLIRVWLIILTLLVAVFNRDALGIILEIVLNF